jgi:hypothetical protein
MATPSQGCSRQDCQIVLSCWTTPKCAGSEPCTTKWVYSSKIETFARCFRAGIVSGKSLIAGRLAVRERLRPTDGRLTGRCALILELGDRVRARC